MGLRPQAALLPWNWRVMSPQFLQLLVVPEWK
jgi:hypothetical protein